MATPEIFELACTRLQEGRDIAQASSLIQSFATADIASTIALCKLILTTSSHSTAPFHASGLLVTVILQNWNKNQQTSFTLLRDEMLGFAMQSRTMSAACRKQLLRVVAIIFKREITEPAATEAVAQLISQRCLELLSFSTSSQPPSSPSLAFELMDALLSEFQSHRASAIGLSLEFHLKAQALFERTLLVNFFNLSMRFLSGCKVPELALVACACAATCLSWDFTTPDTVLQEVFIETFNVLGSARRT